MTLNFGSENSKTELKGRKGFTDSLSCDKFKFSWRFYFEKVDQDHKEAFSSQIASTTRHFSVCSHPAIHPFPSQSCADTAVYKSTSLKSTNWHCTVQNIQKLLLAGGNKHHESLSCFVDQSASFIVCLAWSEFASFQGSGSKSLIASEKCALLHALQGVHC